MIQTGCSTWVRHYSVTTWKAVIAIAVFSFFQSNVPQLCQKHSQQNVLIKKQRRWEDQNQRSVQSNQTPEAGKQENLMKVKKKQKKKTLRWESLKAPEKTRQLWTRGAARGLKCGRQWETGETHEGNHWRRAKEEDRPQKHAPKHKQWPQWSVLKVKTSKFSFQFQQRWSKKAKSHIYVFFY